MAIYEGHPEQGTSLDFHEYQLMDGTLTESAFNEFVYAATAKVDAAIWPNKVTTDTLEKYHRCIKAVLEAMNDPAILKESAGRISVEYAEPRLMATIIREHLSGTGLLYRGL